MACDPVRQSCPPGSSVTIADGEPVGVAPSVDPIPDRSGIMALWDHFVLPLFRLGLEELWRRPAIHRTPVASAIEPLRPIEPPVGSLEGLSPDAAETIQLLERLGQSVPVGVRYPILDLEERRAIEAHTARLGRPVDSIQNTTFFGRHRNAVLNVERQLVDERESWQGTPFRGLVVGAGFDKPHQGRLRGEGAMPISVFEWAAMLDGLGIDWELDVVDPSPEVARYFADLASRDSLTFTVFDNMKPKGRINAVPPDYPSHVFGRYAKRVDHALPQGATVAYEVTLPQSFLQRIHFHQRSVLHPFPRSGYGLVSYMNVQMYLGNNITTPIPPKEESPDVTNLLLNVAPGAWINSEVFSNRPASMFRGTPGVEPALQFSQFIFRATEPVRGRSYLERRPDGGWRVVGGNSSGVSYRSSPAVAPRVSGGELLGSYPGETAFEGSGDFRRDLSIGPTNSADHVGGAGENRLPRPARPLIP